MTDTSELFSRIENAAHEGAFGQNARPIPTDGQTAAGNYKVGKVTIFGLPVAIEMPRNSYRTGTDKNGKRWASRLAAHYGYFQGTKDLTGDPVDCFIGAFPQSEKAFVINQYLDGKFDEFKVMICFPDEESARQAYLQSYDKGWNGLHSIVPASLTQLKWWLKNGNLTKPLKPEHLPYDGLETMNQRVSWGENALLSNMTLDKVIYEIRRADGDNTLLLDSVSMADILAEADEILVFDALVSTQAQLERKMNALMAVMTRAGGDVKPLAMQISDPFKQNGVAQVAAVFELSDGQTVSIFFHNPDVSPAKIAPTDEMISWKWLLNKKDITIVVAPERGKDLNVREVATRIMKLAAKNSPAFQRANTKRAENMAAIESIKGEIVVLENELADAQHELEVAKVEAEDRAAKNQSVDWSKARELGSDAEIQALGVANIDEIGSENVYVEKDGRPYYFKPGNTERWQVGSHDFSNEVVYGDGTTGDDSKGTEQAILQALISLGWQNIGVNTLTVAKNIGGGAKTVTNPDGTRRVIANVEGGEIKAVHGSKILVSVPQDSGLSSAENAKAFDDAVNAIDPNQTQNNEQENQQAEVTTETETAGTEVDPNQPHIDTLQAIVDGQHDGEDLNALLDKIDQAAQALIDAGMGEQYDDLIGDAASHWAELDQKANG